MAKSKPKKSKQTQKSGDRRQDKVETTSADHWQITQSQIGIFITAAIVVIIYYGEIVLSRRRVATIQQQSHHKNHVHVHKCQDQVLLKQYPYLLLF